MAIKFFSDKIQIGDYNLFEGNGGIQFDGVARAENFLSGVGRFQGTVSGYVLGGAATTPTTIQKYPFATDRNATNVASLAVDGGGASSQSSPTYGYDVKVNTIQKFSFASDSNAVSQTTPIGGTVGQSSATDGYSTGYGTAGSYTNTIEKFPFAIDSTVTDVGDLTNARIRASGQSSTTHGYQSGGFKNTPIPHDNIIDKFSFATNANATDVGDLTQGLRGNAGQSSTTHGYSSGGGVPPGPAPAAVNTIQKFPFATDTNAVNVGVLTRASMLFGSNGASSDQSGYSAGGNQPALRENVIDKFPFSTNANATDVGDLTSGAYFSSGVQY